MRGKASITLFPFLSVLISTMGVLSFLAVTFLLFFRQEQLPRKVEKPVEVNWVGAPSHVRPLLVECGEEGVVLHYGKDGKRRFFSLQALKEESRLIKKLVEQGLSQSNSGSDRYGVWVFLKQAIQSDERLRNTFSAALHEVEVFNLSGEGRKQFEQRYPILLVFAEGIETFDLASYLVETTTRLSMGVEPMLKGWALPYDRERVSKG